VAKKRSFKKNAFLAGMLRISIGLFFLMQGIHGITSFGTRQSETVRAYSQAFGGGTVIVEIIMILLFIAAGIACAGVYLLSIRLPLRRRIDTALMIFWAAGMLIFDVLLMNFYSRYFDFPLWARDVSLHGVVLISLIALRVSRS